MNTTEYVYLRNTLSSTGNQSRSSENIDAVIETADLSKKDVFDLNRDPDILTSTPNMPTALIAPVPIDHSNNLEFDMTFMEAVEATQSEVLEDTAEATWGVQAVGATKSNYTGRGAVVAILDTGIDASHERFAGVNIYFQNFTNDGVNGDVMGHGTHCAGTVFGQDIEGKPRIGVAPAIEKALIGKVLARNGSGSTAWAANGIQWAANQGAHIISMSLGSSLLTYFNELQQGGMSLQNALSVSFNSYQSNLKFYESIVKYNQAKNQDCVIIAASGNESGRYGSGIYNAFDTPCGVPAVSEGIISVGALGLIGNMFPNSKEDKKSLMTVASFSNYNNDISAPGQNILSALPNNNYALQHGTSMATPHVAGVAALWVQKQFEMFGHIKPEMLRHQLQGNATMNAVLSDIKQLKIDPLDIGAGLVQAP